MTERWSIGEDGKKFIFKVSGGAIRTPIYNNTIYTDEVQESTFLVFHKRGRYGRNKRHISTISLLLAMSGPGGSTANIFENDIIEG